MKFQFTKKIEYGRRGPVIYETDRLLIDLHETYAQARLTMRVGGPCTAYAEFHQTYEWPTSLSQRWGKRFYKHFSGRQATTKAKAWINYMLNHAPSGYSELSGNFFEARAAWEADEKGEEEGPFGA